MNLKQSPLEVIMEVVGAYSAVRAQGTVWLGFSETPYFRKPQDGCRWQKEDRYEQSVY